MAGVLYVQGVELDVSAADWEPVRLGSVARGFSGQPRSSVRATKRDHHFVGDVAGLSVASAELLRALVEGEGHSWSFDDASGAESTLLLSSRGLLPTSRGSVSDAEGVHGSGAFFEDSTPTVWELGLGADSTIMYWLGDTGDYTNILIRRRAGVVDAVWLDGFYNVTSDPAGLITVDGSGRLVVAGAGYAIDDLVALPYAVPDAWILPLYNWRVAHAWAPLPYVTASGTAFPRGPAQVLGQVGAAKRVPLWSGGTFGLGEVLDFTLQES
ncbi:MAG: hypothetical protein ACJ8AT_06155 [Hyalangium sp.]|uniref:hypothetical protein n=1 Tax=Hyalangium sp. TaxID=2028555 RepID=UPI00389AAF6C